MEHGADQRNPKEMVEPFQIAGNQSKVSGVNFVFHGYLSEKPKIKEDLFPEREARPSKSVFLQEFFPAKNSQRENFHGGNFPGSSPLSLLKENAACQHTGCRTGRNDKAAIQMVMPFSHPIEPVFFMKTHLNRTVFSIYVSKISVNGICYFFTNIKNGHIQKKGLLKNIPINSRLFLFF